MATRPFPKIVIGDFEQTRAKQNDSKILNLLKQCSKIEMISKVPITHCWWFTPETDNEPKIVFIWIGI